MSIDVALNHHTTYRYDRMVHFAPHLIRLRPAPHSRTKILQYSQRVAPKDHFINWQQDPFSNYLARLVFPQRADHLDVEIDLIVRLEAINPFDFFLEENAEKADFSYDEETAQELVPYMLAEESSGIFKDFLAGAPARKGPTNDFFVALNQYVEREIGYVVRMEPGVQTPEETLSLKSGSCRDSAWLLVQVLRHMGYAARFVSGYLIQLKPDIVPVEGAAGPAEDFTDLHAWTEVYLPGAGWVGLDPTSGLFAGEGHIPLACTPAPKSAAPISGAVDPCEVQFDFNMSVRRIHEPPRPTMPIEDRQWSSLMATGFTIDQKLQKNDVRLTVGGEPTFVSATDRDADEWTTGAVGPTKRYYADQLIRRLRDHFAPVGGALHYGQGKWYPGEQLPRWSFELQWRSDRGVLWRNPGLIAKEGEGSANIDDARLFADILCNRLGVSSSDLMPAYEDPVEFALREQNLPANSTPATNELSDPELRRRLVRVFGHGLDKPVAYVLPIQSAQAEASAPEWLTERWNTRRGRLFLIPGDSPAGLRLPLEALPLLPEGVAPLQYERDPFARYRSLPTRYAAPAKFQRGLEAKERRAWLKERKQQQLLPDAPFGSPPDEDEPELDQENFSASGGSIRTAMTIEPRFGVLCIFLPPMASTENYIAFLNAVEDVAEEMGQPIHIEGYTPPPDPRLNVIKVTPDPGVIEVNVQPAHNWAEHVEIIETVYEQARAIGLDAMSFQVDGRPTGSGGGNHIVMGGSQPEDSPFLRRPDLLASIIRYWQNHPSLSYLFSGMFIGPTSQAPRIDEARMDSLFEMEIALAQLPAPPNAPPWLVDRLFRNLLVDVTGNTHRAEICIDKLYSPDGPSGRLGLVEFRGFEMPPHPKMAAAQALVLRALIAMFWEKPYFGDLIRWGCELHDRFLLPHFVQEDFKTVLGDLSLAHGMPFNPEWFAAQIDFRFPVAGTANIDDTSIELRHAIEPWHVLGEEGTSTGTARYVDSSLERLQITIDHLPDHLIPTCNGITLPLKKIGDGKVLSAIRFRAWQPAHCLHPNIPVHAPLTFDLVDPSLSRSLGGCTYFASHPGGRSHEDRPINDLEAEGRRLSRFNLQHTPGYIMPRTIPVSSEFPLTLDMRLS